jgi:TetR/AcrR family transcriptional regulator, transcriptional repressor for nem operon
VGVKSASIHYHFPTKGDLGAALAKRYAQDAAEYLERLLVASQNQQTRIEAYTDIFRSALLNDNRMCLYGIMAAERDDLPGEVRTEVDRFVEVNIRWLAEVLGSSRKSASAKKSAHQHALAVFAAVEGAQLVARGRGDIGVYDAAIEAYRTAGLLP